MSTKTIVITGGPCAGKTSALDVLRVQFAHAETPAVFVPEAATDLILSDIAPWTCESMLEFQTQVIALQIEREANAAAEAAKLGAGAVIVCDRGICDSHAYLSDSDYARALANNRLIDDEALARYDAIFHLETVAALDADEYTRENNGARFENAEEAVAADLRVRAAWSAHPNKRFIANESTFEQKTANLVDAIAQVL